jgi:dolichol-phosphate mannosyltransferase
VSSSNKLSGLVPTVGFFHGQPGTCVFVVIWLDLSMTSSSADSEQPVDRTGMTLIVIPTYNERDNLAPIVDRILSSIPDVDVLIVDDNSPDGTGALADELAATSQRVKVLHREAKEGLGAAYKAGFHDAIRRGYEFIAEMDADGSHQPEEFHRFQEAIKDADLVIGARYIPGGSVVNWPWHRKALSIGGNRYIRLLLGTPLSDATSGYRLFRSDALQAIDLDSVQSRGYVFQADLAFRCLQKGLRVREVPIEFVERERGESKMTADVAFDSLRRITKWGVKERQRQLRARFSSRKTQGTNDCS